MAQCPVQPGIRIEDNFLLDAAAATHFGSLIACGPHAAGLHACMLPTFVTSLGFGVVGVEFTVKYRRPVLPGAVHTMWWTVEEIESRGRNWQVRWTGAVDSDGGECIAATGLILVLGA